MAGFEVIVRPVVFPNIRPSLPRVLPPTQGVAVLSGSGGTLIDLPRSWSVNMSQQRPKKETKRQFDTQKVYQEEKDEQGNKNINKKNYVFVESLKKVRLDDNEGAEKVIYADPPKRENVETVAKDQTRSSDEAGQ